MKVKSKKKTIAVIICIILAVLLFALSLYGNYSVTTTRFTVTCEHLDADFSDYKITHISDLHNVRFGNGNQRLLSEINNSSPDIIVITGDLVDSRRTNIKIAVDFASEAVKIAPVYYVTGNHEARIADYGELEKGLNEAGVTVLHNESVTITKGNSQIQLIGADDPNYILKYDKGNSVKKFLEEYSSCKDSFKILLTHRPEGFEEYCEAEMNLIFSGHAHGGQIRLPVIGGIYAPNQGFFPKYDAGLYTDGDTNMIVSRGLGNSAFPLRMNNRPEIVTVTLKSGKNIE